MGEEKLDAIEPSLLRGLEGLEAVDETVESVRNDLASIRVMESACDRIDFSYTVDEFASEGAMELRGENALSDASSFSTHCHEPYSSLGIVGRRGGGLFSLEEIPTILEETPIRGLWTGLPMTML